MGSLVGKGFVGVALACLLIVTAGATAVSRPAPRSAGKFVDLLEPGSTVTLKQVDGGFEILLLQNTPMLHKVLSVGDDYIVFSEAGDFAELTVPVYQIRSIRKLKKP